MSAEQAACGVAFSHDWHGYLDEDGQTRVCDGEPREAPPVGAQGDVARWRQWIARQKGRPL